MAQATLLDFFNNHSSIPTPAKAIPIVTAEAEFVLVETKFLIYIF